MTVFVDSSALYAVLDADDLSHPAAARVWLRLLEQRAPLLTTSYHLVETFALVQRRLGLPAVRSLETALLPVVEVRWVDEPLHRAAVAAVLTAGKRDLSLVDCAAFVVMRERGVHDAFAFDADFEDQGFACLT